MDTFTSLLASAVVFSVLGHLAFQKVVEARGSRVAEVGWCWRGAKCATKDGTEDERLSLREKNAAKYGARAMKKSVQNMIKVWPYGEKHVGKGFE